MASELTVTMGAKVSPTGVIGSENFEITASVLQEEGETLDEAMTRTFQFVKAQYLDKADDAFETLDHFVRSA